MLGVRICSSLRVPEHFLFRKPRLLKFLIQYKCITSSSQAHFALSVKLPWKSTIQLPITFTEQSKVSTSHVARENKHNLFFQIPRERCTSCTLPQHICLLDNILWEHSNLFEDRVASANHPQLLPTQFLLSI